MRTRLHLEPGQKGTKQLLAQRGDSLVCVRYYHDPGAEATIQDRQVDCRGTELEATRFSDDAVVAVRVAFAETQLRQRVKAAGGRWNADRTLWDCVTPRSSALQWENGLWMTRHLVVDPVGRGDGIHIEMRVVPLHQDASLQDWTFTSDTRCPGLPPNSSWADAQLGLLHGDPDV
jgi:hypothetical protein